MCMHGCRQGLPRSGVAISSREQDTVAPESRNREEAADEEDRVTDEAVTNSIPVYSFNGLLDIQWNAANLI